MSKIAKNIRHLRKLKKLSQEALAEELDVTRSRIGSYEESRSEPPIELLIQLSEYFNLPVDIMIKMDLTRCTDLPFIEVGNQRVLFPIMVDHAQEDMIEIVPVKASAGYLNGYGDPEYIESLKQMKLPFVPTGKHRAFPIKGDSMLPVKEGSFVVGKFVEHYNDILDGKTYILITSSEGIVYKRVYNQAKANDTLLLVSDNKIYQPYQVELKDVIEIWEYTCHINTQEYDAEELNISSIMDMLRQMRVELSELKAVTNTQA